jgi:hypothetical protein
MAASKPTSWLYLKISNEKHLNPRWVFHLGMTIFISLSKDNSKKLYVASAYTLFRSKKTAKW